MLFSLSPLYCSDSNKTLRKCLVIYAVIYSTQIIYLIKSTLFQKLVDNFFDEKLLRHLEMIPIDREKMDPSRLDQCLQAYPILNLSLIKNLRIFENHTSL